MVKQARDPGAHGPAPGAVRPPRPLNASPWWTMSSRREQRSWRQHRSLPERCLGQRFGPLALVRTCGLVPDVERIIDPAFGTIGVDRRGEATMKARCCRPADARPELSPRHRHLRGKGDAPVNRRHGRSTRAPAEAGVLHLGDRLGVRFPYGMTYGNGVQRGATGTPSIGRPRGAATSISFSITMAPINIRLCRRGSWSTRGFISTSRRPERRG